MVETPARHALVIAEALAGTRIAVTGSTGFLGTALVERLLRAVPDCELVLLVRPGRRRTVAQRAKREIFSNDCFDRLRSDLGGAEALDEMVARRVQVIAGDVGTDGLGLDEADAAILASCDMVIHSAATVSFDSPIDRAVEVNLLGPTRIAQTLTDARRSPPPRRRVDLLRRRQPAGVGAGDPGRREPVLERRRLAAGGRVRPPGAGRRRGREPRARAAQAVHGRGPARARRRRHPAAVREVRAAPGRPG